MVVGIDEQIEVAAELLVIVIVVALDRGFLDRPVHSLDLASIRENSPMDCFLALMASRVVRLGEAVIDLVCVADHVEVALSRIDRVAVAGLLGELDAIIGQNRVRLCKERR